MQLNINNIKEICNIAICAAQKANNYISSYDRTGLDIKFKTPNNQCHHVSNTNLASQVVTEVDIKSQEIILKEIEPTISKYNLGLLTEELSDDKSRFEKNYFWCIDPLDGTLPFTEGQEGYSVSIALVAKDGTPVIGVIGNPITKDIYHAIKGVGVFKNQEEWQQQKNIPHNGAFTFVNDRSFFKHKYYKPITVHLNSKIQKMGHSAFKMIKQGGAVMNAIWVLEKQPGCYFKLPKKEKGGGSLWDFAATTCIYNELGLISSNFSGDRLDLNKKDTTFMNDDGVFYGCGIELKDLKHILEEIQSN